MMKFSFFVIGVGVCLLRVSASAAVVPLVNHGDSWRYRKGSTAPQTNWKTVADSGLNSTWLTGNGGFGYADNTNETALCQTILSDMHNSYNTLAMRRSFQVTSNLDSSLHLVLTMDWDDGFIAWLDGVFLASFYSPGAPAEPAFDARATDLHESSGGTGSPQPPMAFDLGAVGSRLSIGTHVLAIMGLNEQPGSSDFIQIADLTLTTPPTNGLSGLIAEDTTWRAVNSPIRLAGDVTVNYGVTLTIEPGVRVLLNSNVSLIINGRLLAEGDPANRIVFSRASASGRWGGITINESPGSPETRLRHAHVEFNGTTAIHASSATVFLDHLTFGSTDHGYISLDRASFVVSECVLPSAAVKFELLHGTAGIKTNGHGVITRNFFGLPVGYSDVIDFTGGNRPGPILHVINNVFSGGSDDGIDLDGTDGWVEGNIFLHVHRNGDTPDSGAAVSGGNNSGLTSEVTIIGNIFFDCDNAATAKQTNFFAMINNTIVHTTRTGGVDIASGAINVRDTTPSPTAFARGFYMEGNIIWDAEELVRNYDAAQTTVTFNNNILPVAWSGPGASNTVTNPLFKHIPQVSEAAFTNWVQAQIVRDWFSLQTNSPAVGSGPNGRDKGGVVPLGVSISGEPSGTTTQTSAILIVGVNRTGFGMPASGWPNGAGYTAYKWRLDGGSWSAERPMALPISLTGLSSGPHYVEVVGKRDSGLYQDDPLFGADAVVTRSRTWMVDGLRITSASYNGTQFTLQFIAQAGQTYSVQYRNAFDAAHPWVNLTNIPAQGTTGPIMVSDVNVNASPTRFYRLASPSTP